MEKNKNNKLSILDISKEVSKNLLKTFLVKIITTLVISASAIFAISATRVPDYKVVVKYRFQKLVEGPVEPGFHLFFPYIHNIEEYDATLKTLTVTDLEGAEGTPLTFIEIISKDKYPAKSLPYIQYTLDKSLPKNNESINPITLRLVQTYGPKGDEEAKKKIERAINDKVRKEVMNVTSKYSMDSLLNYPKQIENEIFENLTQTNIKIKKIKSLNDYLLAETGILIKGVNLKITPSPEYLKQVNEERAAEQLEKDEENKRKLMQAKKLTFLQELEVMKVERSARVEKQRTELEIEKLKTSDEKKRILFQKFLEKWDGKLPENLTLTDKELSKFIK